MAQWQTKENRRGEFDGYTVIGFRSENPDGGRGWHISAWTDLTPIRSYWVAGNDFHSVSIHYSYKGTPLNLIEISTPPITGHIDPEERKAVLKAIGEWEKPDGKR
jgi:hypothetical protein